MYWGSATGGLGVSGGDWGWRGSGLPVDTVVGVQIAGGSEMGKVLSVVTGGLSVGLGATAISVGAG